MPFDFPAAPIVGDQYIAGGATYTWDGLTWNLESSGVASDYVLKSGDTMSGKLGFGMVAISDPKDLSKHIALYDSPTAPFGFSITTNTINIVSPHTVSFNLAGTERASIKTDGFRVTGNVSVSGSITGNHIVANGGINSTGGGGEVRLNVNNGYIIGVLTGGGGSDATSKTYVDTNDGLVRDELNAKIEQLRVEIAELRARR
jgi:hypothetical protein